MKRVIYGLLVLVVSCQASLLNAHSKPEMDSIRLLLHQWAIGLINNDSTAVDETLASEFFGPSQQSRDDYMSRVSVVNIDRFVLNLATHQFVKEGVLISPVVYYGNSSGANAYSLQLTTQNDQWKISGIQSAQVPRELEVHNLPEQQQTYPVTVNLRNEVGEPLHARVHIVDEKGEYWPPRGHQKNIAIGFRQDVGGDVLVEGKTFAYVKPDFTVDLAIGNYRLEVEKGMEYNPSQAEFRVTGDDKKPIELVLSRWANMQASGWYAGDTHTHFLNSQSALLEAQAEDLNVLNVLATKWGEIITNARDVTGSPDPASLPNHVIFFNEETRHPFLGHAILHPIKELIYPLSWGGAGTGVPGGYDYPPLAYQADKAHAQGGLVTWAHFGFRYEAPIDVALGKIDSLDLFTWGDAFVPTWKILGETLPGPLEVWYKMLNTGSRLPATAGTDKMVNTQVSGSVRTYAHMENKSFSYGGWIDAIRHGRTFITTGPMISLTVNGQGIGSIIKSKVGDRVKIEASIEAPYGRYPLEKLELIQNGKVIATRLNTKMADKMTFSVTSKIDQSSWFAVRGYGSTILPYNTWPAAGSWADGSPVMAHTSPIYIDIPGSPIWSYEDAAYLASRCDVAINWVKTEGRYQTEEQREEVITLFEKARNIYLQGDKNQ